MNLPPTPLPCPRSVNRPPPTPPPPRSVNRPPPPSPPPQICEAFGANRYPFPDDVPRQRSMHAEVTSRLRELHTTIEAGDMHRHNVLQGVANSEWRPGSGWGGASIGVGDMYRHNVLQGVAYPYPHP